MSEQKDWEEESTRAIEKREFELKESLRAEAARVLSGRTKPGPSWTKLCLPEWNYERRPENFPEEEKGCPDVVPNDGDNGNYYDIWMSNKDGEQVLVRCLDVIEELNMTFSEGEAFKAIWRKAAARLGKGKADSNPVYDAKKIRFYGESIERMALKEEAEGGKEGEEVREKKRREEREKIFRKLVEEIS